MLLAASQIVAVEDEVTVSPIKVTICGGIHRHLVSFLHPPDLKTFFKKPLIGSVVLKGFSYWPFSPSQRALTWTLPLPSSTMPWWAAMVLLVCRVEASKGIRGTLAMRPIV